jgi:oligopeptide transport system substrate-binding protein
VAKVPTDYVSYLLRLWRCGTVFLVLVASLAWTLTWPAAAPAPDAGTADSGPLTLRLNLTNAQPVTLDPATASGDAAWMVLEQMFAGLVDLDDQTGQIRADLATGWTVSPGGMVYTFTLRSDATWSNGHPVTAHDAAFGLLRSLDPATNSASASLLYGIENAEAYHQGEITDPAEVGVTAVDDTHLRVTLEHPASTMLSILAHLVARPVPRHVVEAWGEAWTDPEHIVTSGPYRLAEWAPGDHLLLTKNPTYYSAAGVQIERVLASRVDDATAWQRYLDGELDTALVPAGVPLDPAQRPDVRLQPYPRTMYLGFSASQVPFDDPLVRQAFSAATNQWGLVRAVFAGPQQPALTFTPPGILGHVEEMGLPYDPAQARRWLADAGHPDGQGLPPVTLWFPVGDESLAGYVQQQWADVLGVTVTLQSLPWEAYRAQVLTGQCQVWRGGWMADYGEAYNWLHDAVALDRSAFGGWTPAAYEDLLGQAAAEQDPDARTALYRQAEQILVETEAIVVPLYADALLVAAQPYLERTYPGFGAPDIATWRFYPHRALLPLVAKNFSTAPSPPADVIFHNGTLLTMEADRPQVQAIAIRADRILAVGNDEKILALQGPGTLVVDLAGRTLLPGFLDGHTHVLHHADDAGWTLDEAMQLVLSYGLTGVTEMSATWDFLDRLMAAEQAGRLRLRVNVFPRYNYPWLDEDGHSIYEGVWFPDHGPILDSDRRLRIPGIKVFADGAFTPGRGCPALTDPYPAEVQALSYFWDICFTERGDLYLEQPEMNQVVAEAQAAGFRVAFHTMGDRGIETVLNAIENALGGASDEVYRHQIQHNSWLRPDLMERYADLHILASVRGGFNTCDQADYLWWCGPEHYEWMVNRFALPGRGIHAYVEGDFGWGSDPYDPASIFPLNPMKMLWGLVTRQQLRPDGTACQPEPWVAEHPISVEQALRMATVEPAFAVSQENVLGSLKPGKFADQVILSGNPLTVAPDALKDVQVWMTMVGGRVEYCAPGHAALCPSLD